jgi:hypothetical protein
MTNKIISNKYALLIATVLSAMMLATSATPSLFPTTAAYAASDDLEVVVDPTVQTDVETEVNVDVDPDVHISTDCEDLNGDNEEVEQEIKLPIDQEDNDEGQGDVVAEPTVQTAVQTGVNVYVAPDVFVIIGCDDGTVEVSDEEEITQINDEPTNQEATSDSEGDLLISPDIQTARETAINYNNDDDIVVLAP